MAKGGPQFPMKRRTRQHVIEEQSVNFLERQALRRGHQLLRPSQREYGWDATMYHFSPEGFVENGEVRFQCKATDHLRFVENGEAVAVRVDARDLLYWQWDFCPFVLIVYDARKGRAYWVHIREYAASKGVPGTQESLTIRIPVRQKLSLRAIDLFRTLSLEAAAKLRERNPTNET
jgi:Domain of unknown function (DUF4365)